ncbi:MAG: replication-associated recombination protein A [Fimbriimonadales bacterium]|nr:replication-associated recombination protein A [Fimbriimonadales bacterium]
MQGDLFGGPSEGSAAQRLPLAARMRPRTLDEYVGQEHLLGPGLPTRTAILEGSLGSVILWAPPGCGKTTLAHLIGRHRGARVEVRSAVTTGVADIREIAKRAEQTQRLEGRPTLLVLDEIHHFNRTQQDSLLGYLEDGTFELVGVTTESPYFVLAPALLSRARVLVLQPLTDGAIEELVRRAMEDSERGLGGRRLSIASDALRHLVACANGDARLALNALEAASLQVADGGEVTLALVEQVLQKPALRYDQQGDYHYDTISAFIKSVRGSDADAALHYLARMLAAGEDPRFIARRLIILASEDIGNADPQGLVVAVAAAQAVERVGMPEGRIVLAQATTYLASAAKSNASYLALEAAVRDVESLPLTPIPVHLRNAPVKGYKELGYGKDYLYPHDFPGHYVEQTYMPEGSWNVPYYRPSQEGYEARIRERRKTRGQPTDP